MRYRHTPTLILAALVVVIVVALMFADNGSSVVEQNGNGQQGRGSASGTLDGPAADHTKHQIRSVICSVFTGSRCGPAIRVATCESRLDPRARGSAGERGLYQLHPVHFGWLDEARLYEPRYNALAAYRLSRGGRSWAHWSCRP